MFMRTYTSSRVKRKSFYTEKWTPDVFVVFRRPYWCTKTVHQYGVSIQSSTKVRETFRQITQKLWATKTWYLVFCNISFSWVLPLDGFLFNFLLRDSENDLYHPACCRLASARYFPAFLIFKYISRDSMETDIRA